MALATVQQFFPLMELGCIRVVDLYEAGSHSEGEIQHWVGFVHSSVFVNECRGWSLVESKTASYFLEKKKYGSISAFNELILNC